MSEIVGAFVRRKRAKNFSDLIPEAFDGSFGGFAQQSLEFCEGHFDRIEVRRVRRQIKEDGARRFDEGAYGGDLMSRQVVHDDDVASPKRRDQELLEPGQEDSAIHRPIDHQRRRDGVIAQAGHESRRLPMAMRGSSDEALIAATSPAQARHRRIGSGLIDEDELVGVKRGLIQLPVFSRESHVDPQLFGRVKAFF